jgi:hypothetical protein
MHEYACVCVLLQGILVSTMVVCVQMHGCVSVCD